MHQLERVPVGHAHHIPLLQGSPTPVTDQLTLKYPTRLNAMALDPAKVTERTGHLYTPGEICFVCNLYQHVTLRLQAGGNEIQAEDRNGRHVLVRHAAALMQRLLQTHDTWHIVTWADVPLKHAGLGSSSRLISAVCAAINEAYGNPLDRDFLMQHVVANHGEEIAGDEDHIMPVQSIGGSAAAGWHAGSVHIIGGEARVIGSSQVEKTMVFGIPEGYQPLDSAELMLLEAAQFPRFVRTGELYRHEIAYRLVHEVLPELQTGCLQALGQLIFDYRFRMGSIENCSFCYPQMLDVARKLEPLYLENQVDVLSLSSVGPGFFAITDHPDVAKAHFEASGLSTQVLALHASGYQVVKA